MGRQKVFLSKKLNWNAKKEQTHYGSEEIHQTQHSIVITRKLKMFPIRSL